MKTTKTVQIGCFFRKVGSDFEAQQSVIMISISWSILQPNVPRKETCDVLAMSKLAFHGKVASGSISNHELLCRNKSLESMRLWTVGAHLLLELDRQARGLTPSLEVGTQPGRDNLSLRDKAPLEKFLQEKIE